MKVYLGLCVCTVHNNIGLQLLSLSCVQQEKAFNLSLKQKNYIMIVTMDVCQSKLIYKNSNSSD